MVMICLSICKHKQIVSGFLGALLVAEELYTKSKSQASRWALWPGISDCSLQKDRVTPRFVFIFIIVFIITLFIIIIFTTIFIVFMITWLQEAVLQKYLNNNNHHHHHLHHHHWWWLFMRSRGSCDKYGSSVWECRHLCPGQNSFNMMIMIILMMILTKILTS